MRKAFRYLCWNDDAHMGRNQVRYVLLDGGSPTDADGRLTEKYSPTCPRCGAVMTFCGLWDLDTKEPIKIATQLEEMVR